MKPPISAGQSKSGRPSKAANLFAKAMIRELNINISPYRDFDELSKAYAFKFDIGRAMFEVNTAARLKEEYFAMLDNAAVIPAEELKIELAFQNLIEKIIGRLRPYADFR